MATTYFLTTTASDLGTGESFSNALSESTPGTTTLTSTIANGDGMAGTIDSSDFAFTPSGDPGAAGTTGNYQLRVEINTGDTNVTLIPQLSRVNSGGTPQSGPTGSDGGGQVASAGSKTFNWTSLDLGTWAAGDRLRVTFGWDNSSTHGGAESVTQDIGSAGTDLDAPWSLPITRNATALNAATLGTHAIQLQVGATALDASANLGQHVASITSAQGPTSTLPDLWLRASEQLVLSGADVIRWQDQSGNARHFTQTAGNQAPHVATLNGLNGPDFDGIDDHLIHSASGFLTGNAGEIVAVCVQGVAGNGRQLLGSGNNDAANAWTSVGPTGSDGTTPYRGPGVFSRVGSDQETCADIAPLSTGSPHLISWRADGAGNHVFEADWLPLSPNVTQIGSEGVWFDDSNAVGSLDNVTLGAVVINGNDGIYEFFGSIYEVVAYDGAVLSASERQELYSRLAERYALDFYPAATALDAGPTLGTHGLTVAGLERSATALSAGPTLGTHAIQLQADATALDASPTYGTHATAQDATASATALDASATLGTHAAQLQASATVLNAGATLGTHAASLATALTATVLNAGATLGTHAASLASGATALNAGATLGTHAASLASGATALNAGATLGTHAASPQVIATALAAGATLGTHAVQIQASVTALAATPVLGTHAAQLQVTVTALAATQTLGTHAASLQLQATALAASPTLGTHAAQLQATATALAANATLGTHAVSLGTSVSATALNAAATLGTHAAQLQLGATALAASATLGTHGWSSSTSVSATALAAAPTLGTHSASLAAAAAALSAAPTLGTHSASLATGATALAATTYGTHTADALTVLSATALDASPAFGAPALAWTITPSGLAAGPTFGTVTLDLVGAYTGAAADSLAFEVASVELASLAAVGTIAGVRVAYAAGANGPGTGRLRYAGGLLYWRAPGSSSWGPGVPAPASDAFVVLRDGANPAAYVRAYVSPAYLLASGEEARVLLRDVYNNALAAADVAAADALAGETTTYQITVRNRGTVTCSRIRVWIASGVSGISVSDDGATWIAPTLEAGGQALDDLPPGSSDTLHVRRAIGVATASDPEILNHLRVGFDAI